MEIDTTVTQKLIAQVSSIAGAEASKVSIETSLTDIGLDSILLALILRAVEVEFAIEFDDEEIASFLGASSVGDYVEVLHRALSRNGRVMAVN